MKISPRIGTGWLSYSVMKTKPNAKMAAELTDGELDRVLRSGSVPGRSPNYWRKLQRRIVRAVIAVKT